jgi:hypothetical protein
VNGGFIESSLSFCPTLLKTFCVVAWRQRRRDEWA